MQGGPQAGRRREGPRRAAGRGHDQGEVAGQRGEGPEPPLAFENALAVAAKAARRRWWPLAVALEAAACSLAAHTRQRPRWWQWRRRGRSSEGGAPRWPAPVAGRGPGRRRQQLQRWHGDNDRCQYCCHWRAAGNITGAGAQGRLRRGSFPWSRWRRQHQQQPGAADWWTSPYGQQVHLLLTLEVAIPRRGHRRRQRRKQRLCSVRWQIVNISTTRASNLRLHVRQVCDQSRRQLVEGPHRQCTSAGDLYHGPITLSFEGCCCLWGRTLRQQWYQRRCCRIAQRRRWVLCLSRLASIFAAPQQQPRQKRQQQLGRSGTTHPDRRRRRMWRPCQFDWRGSIFEDSPSGPAPVASTAFCRRSRRERQQQRRWRWWRWELVLFEAAAPRVHRREVFAYPRHCHWCKVPSPGSLGAGGRRHRRESYRSTLALGCASRRRCREIREVALEGGRPLAARPRCRQRQWWWPLQQRQQRLPRRRGVEAATAVVVEPRRRQPLCQQQQPRRSWRWEVAPSSWRRKPELRCHRQQRRRRGRRPERAGLVAASSECHRWGPRRRKQAVSQAVWQRAPSQHSCRRRWCQSAAPIAVACS